MRQRCSSWTLLTRCTEAKGYDFSNGVEKENKNEEKRSSGVNILMDCQKCGDLHWSQTIWTYVFYYFFFFLLFWYRTNPVWSKRFVIGRCNQAPMRRYTYETYSSTVASSSPFTHECIFQTRSCTLKWVKEIECIRIHTAIQFQRIYTEKNSRLLWAQTTL